MLGTIARIIGTWAVGEAYTINTVVIAMAASDTYYWPFIDDENVSGSTLTATIKFVSTTELIARMRFSDPDVGGQRQNPFVQKSAVMLLPTPLALFPDQFSYTSPPVSVRASPVSNTSASLVFSIVAAQAKGASDSSLQVPCR